MGQREGGKEGKIKRKKGKRKKTYAWKNLYSLIVGFRNVYMLICLKLLLFFQYSMSFLFLVCVFLNIIERVF